LGEGANGCGVVENEDKIREFEADLAAEPSSG